MEASLPWQRPISCISFFGGGVTQLLLQSCEWQKAHKAIRITHPFTANADFSRRRLRKTSTPKCKDSTTRGFMPRTQLPTSTQRRDTKNNEEKEGPGNSPSNDFEGSNVKTVEMEIGTDDKVVANFSQVTEIKEESENESNNIDIEAASTNGPLCSRKISHFNEKGTLPKVVDNVMEPKDAERFTKSEEKDTSTADIDDPEFERVVGGKQRYTKHDEALWHESIERGIQRSKVNTHGWKEHFR